MVDKIKPLKVESSSSGGTENNLFPTEADPTEDYSAVKGIAFENSDSRLLDLDGSGVIQGTDARGWTYPVGEDFTALLKEPTGFPNRTDSELSFTDGSLTFTIEPTATSFDYYIDGRKYTVSSADSVVITDTDGLWFIYYDGATLTASQTSWSFGSGKAFVALVYWDATNNKHIILAEERHGLKMDNATHERLHFVDGVKIAFRNEAFVIDNYTAGGDGSNNTHAQCSFGNGTIYDEDIEIDIINSASPTNPFEQKLSTIAYIPLYYKTGSGDGVWRKLDATAYPLSHDSPNTVKYNKYDSGTWSLDNATNNSYVITWVLATNNMDEPLIGIIDSLNSTSLVDIIGQQWDGITVNPPSPEYIPIYKLIFRTSTSYTNDVKAALYDERDLRVPVESEDRYTVIASYGGNATTGRYLEIFPSVASDEAPFDFPEDSFIRTMTLRAASDAIGTVSVYNTSDLSTALLSISLSSESYKKSTETYFFSEGDSIAFKVSSGSILKPAMRVWIQTTLEL